MKAALLALASTAMVCYDPRPVARMYARPVRGEPPQYRKFPPERGRLRHTRNTPNPANLPPTFVLSQCAMSRNRCVRVLVASAQTMDTSQIDAAAAEAEEALAATEAEHNAETREQGEQRRAEQEAGKRDGSGEASGASGSHTGGDSAYDAPRSGSRRLKR